MSETAIPPGSFEQYGDQSRYDTGSTNPQQPRPPYETAAGYGPPPPVPPAAAPARRPRRGMVAMVGVALVAGLAGGTVGAAVDHATTHQKTSATSALTTSSTATNTSSTASTGSVSAVAAAALPTVVQIDVTLRNGSETGSGIIITSDGNILTNNHVVADAANGQGTIKVTFSSGKTATATIVGTEASSDLAVIKAQGVSGLKVATLGDSSKVQVGDSVVAIGSPEGLQNTVTTGVVSALNREVTVQSSGSGNGPNYGYPWSQDQSSSSTVTYKAIQTDASINPGNSGGPLLNMAGQVIGIDSAMYSPSSSGSGESGSVGLGFAIPINQAKTIAAKLLGKSVL